MKHDPPVYATTQRTAKRLKLQIALSTLLLLVGVAWWAGTAAGGTDTNAGKAIFFAAAVWRIITGIRIWWEHE